jgi:hypothetical protein
LITSATARALGRESALQQAGDTGQRHAGPQRRHRADHPGQAHHRTTARRASLPAAGASLDNVTAKTILGHRTSFMFTVYYSVTGIRSHQHIRHSLSTSFVPEFRLSV